VKGTKTLLGSWNTIFRIRITMDTDTGIEIKDGGVVVDIPIESLVSILREYPDITVGLQK